MKIPKVLIPMADYGHDPTGEALLPTYLRQVGQYSSLIRDRHSIYRIQEGWLPSPVCDRDWEGAGMRQEDAARCHSKAASANPSFAFA